MLASDTDLANLVRAGEIVIEPTWTLEEQEALVQPASIDVRLGRTFKIFRAHGVSLIDPALSQQNTYEEIEIEPGRTFVLHPGQFALGHTYETITVSPSLAVKVEGKSSLGRLGLMIHSTAGYVDPGFSGEITLEMSNLAPVPILLRPGMAIGQLAVTYCMTESSRPYGTRGRGSRYQGQAGAVASRGWQHFKVWPMRDRVRP